MVDTRMLTLQVGVTFDSCMPCGSPFLRRRGNPDWYPALPPSNRPDFAINGASHESNDFKKESDDSDDSVAYRRARKVFRGSFATLSPKWKLLWKHLSRLSLVNVSCGPRLCETFPGFFAELPCGIPQCKQIKHPYVAALVSSLKGSRTYWSLYVSLSLNPLWGFPGAANLLPSCLISFMAESSLFPLPVFHQLPTAQLMKTDIAFLHFEKFDE